MTAAKASRTTFDEATAAAQDAMLRRATVERIEQAVRDKVFTDWCDDRAAVLNAAGVTIISRDRGFLLAETAAAGIGRQRENHAMWQEFHRNNLVERMLHPPIPSEPHASIIDPHVDYGTVH